MRNNWRGGSQTAENLARDAGLQWSVPPARGTNGVRERIRTDVLEQVPGRAGLDGPKYKRVVVEGGEYQNLDIGPPLFDALGGADSIGARHAQVHQHHAWLEFCHELLRL